MKTPKAILQAVLREHNVYFDAGLLIDALEREGYAFNQAVKWPHTIEHELTPVERGVF